MSVPDLTLYNRIAAQYLTYAKYCPQTPYAAGTSFPGVPQLFPTSDPTGTWCSFFSYNSYFN